jgi:hypothetical protein
MIPSRVRPAFTTYYSGKMSVIRGAALFGTKQWAPSRCHHPAEDYCCFIDPSVGTRGRPRMASPELPKDRILLRRGCHIFFDAWTWCRSASSTTSCPSRRPRATRSPCAAAGRSFRPFCSEFVVAEFTLPGAEALTRSLERHLQINPQEMPFSEIHRLIERRRKRFRPEIGNDGLRWRTE